MIPSDLAIVAYFTLWGQIQDIIKEHNLLPGIVSNGPAMVEQSGMDRIDVEAIMLLVADSMVTGKVRR